MAFFPGLSWAPIDDKKAQELHVVQIAAKILGEPWVATEGESPDFTVMNGSERFGLEVTQLFIGNASKKGDSKRRAEAMNSAWLQSLKLAYSTASNASLYVSYRGPTSQSIGDEILQILLSEDLGSKPSGYWFKRNVGGGLLHVRVGLEIRWLFLGDMNGWASYDNAPLQRAIEKKSFKAAMYREAERPKDLRLLAFNNPWLNSGKLVITKFDDVPLGEFSKIYILNYPFEVTTIDQHGWNTIPEVLDLSEVGSGVTPNPSGISNRDGNVDLAEFRVANVPQRAPSNEQCPSPKQAAAKDDC